MAESGSDLGCGESVIGLDSFAVEENAGMHRRNGPGTAANGFYPAYRSRPLVILRRPALDEDIAAASRRSRRATLPLNSPIR